MNHYETLGIPKDATPDEIKSAWRRAASAAHPDRAGGSTEQAQAVNQAYECLSDPERRKRYDETGSDVQGKTLAEEALELLAELFRRAIEADVPEIVPAARNGLDSLHENASRQIAQSQASHDRMVERRARVSTKDGARNIVHHLIDEKIKRLDGQIEHAKEALRVHDEAMKEIDRYESEPEERIRADALFSFRDADAGFIDSSRWWGRWR